MNHKKQMKRPRRPSISKALSLTVVAFALSSPPHRNRYHFLLASAASLRATQSPAADDGNGSSSSIGVGDEEEPPRVPLPLHPQATATAIISGRQEKKPQPQPQLTVKLSASSHPRAAHSSTSSSGKLFVRTEDRSPEIPLIGIGVGNLPHGKVPYMLASALGLPSKNNNNKKKKKRKSGGVDVEELNYRLVDTSHTADSALEVLVGRSLSRLSASKTASTSEISTTATTTSNGSNTSYHVMIKIWHTHLGLNEPCSASKIHYRTYFPDSREIKTRITTMIS